MTAGPQFRASNYYSAFYVGLAVQLQFAVYEVVKGVQRPKDLSTFDSVRMQIYDTDGAGAIRQQVVMNVLTADADKILDVDGTTLVKARCEGTLVPSGSAATVRVKLIGRIGAQDYILDKPWLAQVYLGGPGS